MNLAFNQEKRRYVRYELLDYALVEFDDDTEPVAVVVTDIGLGGLQVRSKTDLIEGKGCTFRITVEGQPDRTLRGEIRHSAAVATAGMHTIGIRFTPRTHDERVAVAEFVHDVFRRQAEVLAG